MTTEIQIFFLLAKLISYFKYTFFNRYYCENIS